MPKASMMSSVMTTRLRKKMKKIWTKTKEFVIKYWKMLLALFAGLALYVRFKLTQRKLKKVLKNEIETNKKIREAEKEFTEKVEKAREEAETAHEDRLKEIDESLKEELEAAKKDADDRKNKNLNATDDELAKRFADTFGVKVVSESEDDDE